MGEIVINHTVVVAGYIFQPAGGAFELPDCGIKGIPFNPQPFADGKGSGDVG